MVLTFPSQSVCPCKTGGRLLSFCCYTHIEMCAGAAGALRLEVGEAKWVVLRLAPKDADPALALLEHLTTST